MKSKFFFFIFKYNYRKRAFNNFLKIKKIKNYYIFNFSGVFKYYLIGYPLYTLINKFKFFFKNFIFISCDSEPQLQFNGINLWFGGTSHKVPEEYKKYKNNCFVIENLSKKEENLLSLYPYKPLNLKSDKEPKIIFIGNFNIKDDKFVDEIWNFEKQKILNSFTLIDTKQFWDKYNLYSNPRLQYYYIQLKERLRLNIILELNKIFEKKLILVGSKWQAHIPGAIKDEYNFSKIINLYNGNICLDFGSKWGLNNFYPRSIEIIESGGLLVQSKQLNSLDSIDKNDVICSSNNIEELEKLLKKLLIDKKLFYERFKKQYNFFNNEENNYLTFSKIYEIASQNNIK
tara:strand:+ start:69 stop:1100 length:1032 start_codon:yes stop_codon:yes gene_type:complete